MKLQYIMRSVHLKPAGRETEQFYGAFLEPGASISVCVLRRAKASAALTGFKFKRISPNAPSSLANQMKIVLGPSSLACCSSYTHTLKFNISVLIGLDARNKSDLFVNNVKNLLVHDKAGWIIPLGRRIGHLY